MDPRLYGKRGYDMDLTVFRSLFALDPNTNIPISTNLLMTSDGIGGIQWESLAWYTSTVSISNIKILDGGFQSWTHEGYPTESTSEYPSDNDCVDYLFFVHDRHAGNREAMKAYLSWETGLMAQMTDDEKKLFRIPQS